jgi:hypothetical protein
VRAAARAAVANSHRIGGIGNRDGNAMEGVDPPQTQQTTTAEQSGVRLPPWRNYSNFWIVINWRDWTNPSASV